MTVTDMSSTCHRKEIMLMIFRDFVEALCYVSSEEITARAALTLLRVAIGDDHVQAIFPNTDVEMTAISKNQ